jgi:hypothetical protein
LSGPCGEVELVALDPLPQGEAEAVNRLLCVDRERFVGFLLRKGSGHQGGDAAYRAHAASEAPRGAVPVVVDRVAPGGAYGVGKAGRA